MSRAPHDASNVPNAGFGDYRYPPPPAQNPELHGLSNFVDGSGPIFSMYMEMATEEDKKMAENWKADADGILIFTGLFSAAVASLISVSIQDIRPNPQDTSNFYLANIYQTVADPNISTSLPTSPPQFSPPNYAVWVNSLWFMSLVISLTCALLATLLQQWARRYLKVTQSRYSPHNRVRIRAFFAEGIDKFLLPWVVETLPALLHVSLFLFFAGLVVFLCNVNITIFKLVLSWIGICTALYGCITLVPIFRLDSPYYTSLSSTVWLVVVGIGYVVFRVRWWSYNWWSYLWAGIRCRRRHLILNSHHQKIRLMTSRRYYHKLLSQGMHRTIEKTALKPRAEIDTRAFLWTFDSLDEDHELERFYSGLPGFRSSKEVEDPLPSLTDDEKQKLFQSLTGLLKRTFSSDLLSAPVKKRRAMICAKAIDPAHHPGSAFEAVEMILSNDRGSGSLAAEFLPIVRGWRDNADKDTWSITQTVASSIIAMMGRRDDPWFILASDELGVPESVLREHAAHGDSLSLAILIHVTRQQFNHFREASREMYKLRRKFSRALKVASDFGVRDTLSPLQHSFCALWNQIVLHVQNHNDTFTTFYILGSIRNIYVALHQDTDSAPTRFSASTASRDPILQYPFSYPVCNVAGHIHGTVFHDNDALPPASLANLDSSTVPTPPRIVESPTEVLTLDNLLPVHRTAIEGLHIPVTSPHQAIAGVIQDIVTSGLTVPHYTPDTSTSTSPLSSTSPPASVSLQHNSDPLTPSDPPYLPSSTSSSPVLENINILPTGPLQSSHSPITRSDLPLSFSESHRSIIVTIPGTFPGPTSALNLSTTARDGGSAKPGLRRDKDVGPLMVHSTARASTMTALDLVPQSLLLQPDADLDGATVMGPSQRAERTRTGYHSAHHSYSQYDIA
ncbi:hypothetical protein EDB87DRAFT_1688836 [Lactarius vividus]|nr:hypothetical protein EDB87DRAFT_1688836 [Lactarius vividus]